MKKPKRLYPTKNLGFLLLSPDINVSKIVRVLERMMWEEVEVDSSARYFNRPDGFFVWLPEDLSHDIETIEWWLEANDVDLAEFWRLYQEDI